jgi:hypothetical protein
MMRPPKRRLTAGHDGLPRWWMLAHAIAGAASAALWLATLRLQLAWIAAAGDWWLR